MNDDFIVTVHALQRFDERFPAIGCGLTDRELGDLIHTEVMDALDAGRRAKIPPIELAHYDHHQWLQRNPGAYYVWTKEKDRGYAIVEDESEGMLVKTVIYGEEREVAIRKLRRLQTPSELPVDRISG